ncbi:beta-1,4-galactosyltransferase 4 [Bufo gargarizans]|uniref:beta-1,4-galactosyltransferase 4 n=1 Tax=Bufo gargarizans TaxID=30331 RepID=UPI001CF46EE5|nr:beta-1,4-galactosyltransferase 4 [Bufo gargarizans]XP_044140036.1 beta-1,4-galactosyltransferase 4 [Bufo gargarizans]XP_044140037.1 beta-1,4-galactosyltransferase 4 [Bufo gargarizans]XP_044140038.1 beta-1,4-galactosyltransferase 4 [Bufo gargarizans]XP_044140039.1 beta-1,4-galactosyltransferase 4 [Bufo gargarizans]XP_044140040.1 beta-1,4-galactosyltransferase 4 [Bufo gargarizans]
MGMTSTVGSFFCKIRFLLLIAVCITIVGWATFYVRESTRYTPKFRTSLDNFWKYPSSEKKFEGNRPPPAEEHIALSEADVKICPVLSPQLKGIVPLTFPPNLSLEDVQKKYPMVSNGYYQPETCRAQQKVAILIPHRNREKHLIYLLDNLHPFLQRQQLDYAIYIIHQAGDVKFNRAKLLNVGYLEALKEDNWDCFIFHDVDLVPENDFNTYLCDSEPKHLVVGRNATGYKLWYKGYFGGVTAMTRKQFSKVNGYSNNYWGWGGEDDDLRYRVEFEKMAVVRPPPEIARYTMIFHTRDAGNEINKERMQLLRKVSKVWKKDGLNSCTYKLLSIEHEPLYINITVDIGKPHH